MLGSERVQAHLFRRGAGRDELALVASPVVGVVRIRLGLVVRSLVGSGLLGVSGVLGSLLLRSLLGLGLEGCLQRCVLGVALEFADLGLLEDDGCGQLVAGFALRSEGLE